MFPIFKNFVFKCIDFQFIKNVNFLILFYIGFEQFKLSTKDNRHL